MSGTKDNAEGKRWPTIKALSWQEQNGWFSGCNFQPSTAVNQLEMWQKETFDTATINRESGWAEDLSLNAMRVYLHRYAWKQDSAGFIDRLEQYLTISNKHNIMVS